MTDTQPSGAESAIDLTAERALFEHAERASDLTRSEGGEDEYLNPCVQSAWDGWKARAALARRATAPHAGQAPAACDLPPEGWHCTRAPGHDGPCAAYSIDDTDNFTSHEEAIYQRGVEDGKLVARGMARLKAGLAAQPVEAGSAVPDWFAYDESSDTMIIHGIKYSGELMREFGRFMPTNQPFLLENRANGVLTVTKLDWAVVDRATHPAEPVERPGHKDCYCGGWTDIDGDFHEQGCPVLADQPVDGALVAKADPVYQRQEAEGAWRDTTLLGHQAWADSGRATRLVYLAPESAAAPADHPQAARDVLAERRRQVEAEGWTPEHDSQYQKQELRWAAFCYMRASDFTEGAWPAAFPWPKSWWKPTSDRRNLVKAGALILAEIERLDRATQQPTTQGSQA